MKYVSPGILFPHALPLRKFSYNATGYLLGYMHDVIRYIILYLVSPNNKGPPTVVILSYTPPVCVALRCAVLPEVIIAFKAEIIKSCSVSNQIYYVATSNRL